MRIESGGADDPLGAGLANPRDRRLEVEVLRQGGVDQRIEDRIGALMAKYFDGGFSGHVTVEKSGPRFSADCVIFLDSGMTLQAEGSYAKAKQMIETLGNIRPQAQAVLDKLTAVPVDIEPRFVTAIDLLK